MQLIHLIIALFLPTTILAHRGDGHPGGYRGDYHPGEGYHPYRNGKSPHAGVPTGGYPHGAARPTGTGGYPAGTGSPTPLNPVGPDATGAGHANDGPYKRNNYPPHDFKPKYGHGQGHGQEADEDRPRWTNGGKHDGAKPRYPISPTGSVPDPTGGLYPTASSGGYPVPTGRPSGGLRRRHPRMM